MLDRRFLAKFDIFENRYFHFFSQAGILLCDQVHFFPHRNIVTVCVSIVSSLTRHQTRRTFLMR